MKIVLIMLWIGAGHSNVPAIEHVKFEHLAACERAAKQFLDAKLYSADARYKAAFCIEDRP